MTPQRNRRAKVLLIVAGALVAAVALLILFFPTDRLRVALERQASGATGYTVRMETLRLALHGLGIGLRAGTVTATSADGGQEIAAPEVRLRVKLLPLLRGRVEVEALAADEPLLHMRPVERRAGGAPPPGGADRPRASAAFLIPDIRIRDGRMVQEGTGGITRLFGVDFDGRFDSAVTGADRGRLTGHLHADSTTFAPRATPTKPLRFPAIDADFESRLHGAPLQVSTTLTGTLGPLPARGTVESNDEAEGWRNRGDITFDSVDAATLGALLPAAAAGQLNRYDLGGRLEDGRLTFETTPGRAEMDYAFTGKLDGLTATLPDKGKVIDSGTATLDVRPDLLTMVGALRSGQASLDVTARVRDFAAPAWTANIHLVGPAVEALRFAPQPDLEVRSGDVDARIEASGRLGEEGLPAASGTIVLSALALSHPAVAVPVERFDGRITLAGTRLDLANGYVKAGQSEAWFEGRMADWKTPALDVTIQARTIHLDELFPETPAAGSGGGTGAPAQPTPAPPVRGRITIDRLVRDDIVLTGVSSNFVADAAGMRLTDLDATSYGGRVRGDLTLKPQGKAVLDYSGHLAITDMRAEDLLAAWTPIRGIEGRLNTDIVLSGQNGPGIDAFSVLSLIGKGLVLEGQLVNIPALQKVSEALQFEAGAVDRIPFKTLRHHVRIENGFAQLDTFRVAQVNADWTIGGRIGLDGRLDCPVTARLAPTLFRPGSDLARVADVLAGPDGRVEIGLRLGGTLKSPTVSIDLDPLLARVRQKGEEALVDEVRKRLGDLLRRP